MYELVSPVSLPAVLRYCGGTFVGIGIVLLVPAAAAVFFGETAAGMAALGCALLSFAAGAALLRHFPETDLEWKEALVLAAIAFPAASLLCTLPLSLSSGMNGIDAFFESVSGLTTTGLSVAPVGVPAFFLFFRSWLQWVGGIGIVVLVLTFVVGPGTSALRLYTASIGDEERLRPTIGATVRLLFSVYLALTVVAFLLLLFGGMEPFDALCHALSGISTGGFSTRPESVAAFGGVLPALVILSSLMGAVSIGLYPALLKDPLRLLSDIQVQVFAVIAVAGFVLLLFILGGAMPLPEAVPVAAFQVLSALTTSGFSTIDIGALPPPAKAVLSLLMCIGGSIGSTAGGIKILRLILVLALIRYIFLRFSLPREAVVPFRVGGHLMEWPDVYAVVGFIFCYIGCIILSALVFMLAGAGMEDAVFEVASALGTVGLSTGLTGPDLPVLLKAVLCIDMLMGRIEVMPFLVMFMPRTWIRPGRD
ncbi:TrkH family potassium uptake protein [Methanofollis fontis]|uniref:Potassium transporter n=1 Tax=Methanofollis fontis TaxID=2052832 RepID=A0A483CTY6_9EURY|nr:TrkH family potassium uptake protein [Methanofollis fontis]TAJ44788.1 potassium transporter [Methanofollis fontis]